MRDLRILIVGVGGLGCPAVLGLAAAGVKRMTLLDPDQVELSNLHRQVLYSEKDLGRPKVEAARQRLAVLYPGLEVEAIQGSFSGNDAERILSPYDLVIDGLDRIEKKFILNDWCVKLDKPYVHAGVVGFEGQVMAVLPGKTACLRCLIPKIPPPFAMPTCREAGVLGSFSQAIGYFQALEALRLAKEEGPFRLWKWNALRREARSLLPERDPQCQACGQGKVEIGAVAGNCEVQAR
ncbi:MAG TPA: HesA/MoeB/ThiF family protein [bacterium]|nr:HesA/MoeB/ThiF family protein [bacterium]